MNELTINTIDIAHDLPPKRESVEITLDAIEESMAEADLVAALDARIDRAEKYWKRLKLEEHQQENYKYWVGDQIDESKLREDLERGVDNAIFRNIETFLPIANSRTPELTATPGYKNQRTRSFAKDVQRALQTEWEVFQNMQPLLGRGIRNHQMMRLGVFMYGYDPDTESFWTEEIIASDVVVSQHGDFVARWIRNETLGDLIEKFPDKKKQILSAHGWSVNFEPSKKILASPVEYIEAWTETTVVWKLQNTILGKDKNPHFDYEGVEIEVPTGRMVPVQAEEGVPVLDPQTGQPMMKPEVEKKTIKYNHFASPKIPFLFLNYFNRGTQIYDDTTLIEQAIGPQDWINKRKRQIGMNADSTNGHWVSSGDYISKEEFMKIEGGIDEKIWLENGKPMDGIQKVMGNELPQYVYNDLLDSRGVIDNLMGTHSTTRGESSGNDTATQDIMQKDQDYGRIDGYVRDGVEKMAKEWYEAMYHMYLVYHTEDRTIPIPDDEDLETENVIFSRERVPLIQKKDGTMIAVPMVLKVKQGSTLPRDEVSAYQRARQMKEMLSRLDFFKLMGMPNPRELAKNKLIEETDPFYMFKDDEDVQAALNNLKQQQAQQMQAEQLAATTNGGGAAPAPDTVPRPAGGAAPALPQGSSPEGVANALRAIIEEQGMSAEEVLNSLQG